MLGPGCIKGFFTVGRHREEVREGLAEVAWVRLLLASGSGDLKHQWHHYDVILWFKAYAGERLLAERPEMYLVLAQTQTTSARRICDQNYTHTHYTLGITVRTADKRERRFINVMKAKGSITVCFLGIIQDYVCIMYNHHTGHKASSICACLNFSMSF